MIRAKPPRQEQKSQPSPPETDSRVLKGVEPNLKGTEGPLRSSLKHAMQKIEGAMQENQKGEKLIQNLAVLYWERVVGTQAALSTEADTVRDGILFVNTRNSVWSHELTLYKKRILADINALLGEECLLDIKFRVRKLRQDAPPLQAIEPTPEDLRNVVLEPAERAELRARLEALIEIPDDKIREKIALRLVGDARLRHWRITHGWKICVRCQGLHTEPERLCPICRLYG